MHFPLLRHGDELHAVSSDISQRLAENPTGHLHWKFACPLRMITSHVPPFWQRGAVRQGFGCSQNSPTYRDVQLFSVWEEAESKKKSISEIEKWILTVVLCFIFLGIRSTYLQYEFPIPVDLQIPLFLQGEGLQDGKPVFFPYFYLFCYGAKKRVNKWRLNELDD